MLCRFAEAFPQFIADLLERERDLRRRFREETVSDLWIASLVPMRGLQLRIDMADEAETGADVEIWFLSAERDRGVGFVIQAKRSHCGQRGLPGSSCERDWELHRFEELDHAAGGQRSAGTQARDLTHAAERSGRAVYPLYSFYNPAHIFNKSGRIQGVMLADAHDVRRRMVLGRQTAWRRRVRLRTGKWRSGAADYKRLGELRNLLFSLDAMFCIEPWAPIYQVATTKDIDQAVLLKMGGDELGVVTVPGPDAVARSVSRAIISGRSAGFPGQSEAQAADLPLPRVTSQIPSDILQLASGGGPGAPPDRRVASRRVVCVATAMKSDSASGEADEVAD